MRLTTKEILAFRSLNRAIDEKWIDWAVSMLKHGYDTPHLCILAGESPPYENRQFELIELVDTTLEELKFTWSDREHVVKEYITELVQNIVNGSRTSQAVLRELRDLYIDLDYVDYLSDFYYLFYAQKDLQFVDEQFYWADANRSNIENIIHNVARNWIDKFRTQI